MARALPKVLIADDEAHIRMLLKALVSSLKCEIIGEAANGNEAVELVKLHKPNIVLMDVNMPFKTGDEALKDIIKISPSTIVIMLTSVSDFETIEECLQNGASGYIRKDTPPKDLRKLVVDTWNQAILDKRG